MRATTGALIDLTGRAEADQRELGEDFRVGAQHFLDHAQARVGVVDRGTERRAQIDEETTFVLLRRESLADVGEEGTAQATVSDGECDDLPAMPQRPAEDGGRSCPGA